MIEVKGKGCISAKIIADSVSSVNGQRITTYELEYPRFIHGEFMTHRLFSRNAMSSRAVPIAKMIEQVETNPAMPIVWGKNQPGMQAKEIVVDPIELGKIERTWIIAAKDAGNEARELAKLGLHKQIVNRILEPFQIMKTVVTATEFDNFFYLRCHSDAQPEIKELADCMYEGYQQSKPERLNPGEWHTPYVQHYDNGDGMGYYVVGKDGCDIHVDLDAALKISSSCCAQVSYRLLDNSIDKAVMIYDKLVESKPVHASPFEHQGTPMEATSIGEHTHEDINDPVISSSWQKGVTYIDARGSMWSGNFLEWIQHRQLVDGHVCNYYEG